MNKGGRPKDNVWSMFEEGQDKKLKCKSCNSLVSSKADRLRNHLNKCSNEMKEVAPTTALSVVEGGLPPQENGKKRPAPYDFNKPPAAKRIQSDLWGHVISTPSQTKDKIDEAVAECVFGCNLPFAIVEHPLFRKMLETLRPGYKPPSRKTLSNGLLEQVHGKLQASMKVKLQGKVVTMQQDGWSTLHNDPVISTSITCEGNGYFVDAQYSGENAKTAEYCQDMLKKSKSFAEQSYGCTVRTIVTDNARNMVKMREALEAEDEELTTYGCLAHWLNLLGQDLTPQTLMRSIVDINKYFRNHHIPSALLNNQPGSVRPQLPGDTRWKSQLNCIDSYMKNRPRMIQIIQDNPDSVDSSIQRKIMEVNIFRKAKELFNQLQPIAIALDRAQGDKTTLADSYDIMNKLLNEPALASSINIVKKRKEQAILPCHMVAFMLHPKYAGKGMDPEDAEKARMWLQKKNPDFLPAAVAFLTQIAPYPKSFFLSPTCEMGPATWWQAVGLSCNLPDGFVDLMIKFHSATSSSASLERIFSSFGLVLTKLRNKLGLEKAQKLVYCYRMLRGPQELDY